MNYEIRREQRLRSQTLPNFKNRSNKDDWVDNDPGFSISTQISRQRMPLMPPFSKPAPSKWDDAQKWIATPLTNQKKETQPFSRRSSFHGGKQTVTQMLIEDPNKKEVENDLKQVKKEMGESRFIDFVTYPNEEIESYAKQILVVKKSAINLNQHDTSLAVHKATTFITPPVTVKAVSMRDMGTEMTPTSSQGPSRSATPVKETVSLQIPTSSEPLTAGIDALTDSPTSEVDLSKIELSKKELHFGSQFGKTDVGSLSRMETEKDCSNLSKAVAESKPDKTATDTYAEEWEEVKRVKYMTRYKHEEVKIQAWQNRLKEKTQKKMKKIEAEVEKKRQKAHDKLMRKLQDAKVKSQKNEASKIKINRREKEDKETILETQSLRKTGCCFRPFSCWSCCFRRNS